MSINNIFRKMSFDKMDNSGKGVLLAKLSFCEMASAKMDFGEIDFDEMLS